MRVIDSSSLAKFVNNEENWERVEEVLRAGCVSLEFAVKETGISLWVRVHRGELDARKAGEVFDEFVASRPFVLAGQEGLYVLAFKLASANDVSLYDALFLALAKDRRLPLVTSDTSQAAAAEKMGLEVELIP